MLHLERGELDLADAAVDRALTIGGDPRFAPTLEELTRECSDGCSRERRCPMDRRMMARRGVRPVVLSACETGWIQRIDCGSTLECELVPMQRRAEEVIRQIEAARAAAEEERRRELEDLSLPRLGRSGM